MQPKVVSVKRAACQQSTAQTPLPLFFFVLLECGAAEKLSPPEKQQKEI